MPGLRETKKAATKYLIAEQAAQILLNDGLDHLTVANIAAAANVSPRTFHNYFPSRAVALTFFLQKNVRDMAKTMTGLIEDGHSLLDSIEILISNALKGDQSQVDSFVSLFRVASALNTFEQATSRKVFSDALSAGLEDAGIGKDLSEWERFVILNLSAQAGALSSSWYKEHPDEDVDDLVKRTFKVLREGTDTIRRARGH